MTGLLDTNAALYLLGGKLASPLPPGDYGVSVITQMELLSWPSLTMEETKRVNAFLSTLTLCDLTPAVRAGAISLRREERLKLPDAIICATALELGVELWTNDARLAKVPGLVEVRCKDEPAAACDRNYGEKSRERAERNTHLEIPNKVMPGHLEV